MTDVARSSDDAPPRILLVAPNISTTMGGEALKALQIHLELRVMGIDVHQVTHARVAQELASDHPDLKITFLPDDGLQIILHRLGLGPLLSVLNAWQLNRVARRVAATQGINLVHFTSPISPILPYFRMPGRAVVIGPLNGNIYHPPAFAGRETRGKRFGQKYLTRIQSTLGWLFPARKDALLLVSGGERTRHALELAGLKRERMVTTLDSGIPPLLEATPRLMHDEAKPHFVFAGRLVRYKACDLAIRAIARSTSAARLDVIGDGEERGALEALVDELGIRDRVTFRGWVKGGEAMFTALRNYRAMLMPTLAEANGIGVQEAMMIGLPVICVDWGGPAELLNAETGVLIEPLGEEQVVSEMAHAIDRLANEPAEADRLSTKAREDAIRRGFTWRPILTRWFETYDRALGERDFPPAFVQLASRGDGG